MPGVAVSNTVIARSGMGRFISECEAAATMTVEESIQQGAEISRGLAPMKTGALAGSIDSAMISATAGHWWADRPYAMDQEFGAGAHIITGNPKLSFWWENVGEFVELPYVNHPGNPPKPYLRPAYETVMGEIMSIAAANYPG